MCRLEKFHLPLRPKLKDWNMMTLNRKWMRLIVLVGCAALTASCKQAPVAQMEAEYAVLKVSPSDKVLSTTYSATIRGRQDIDIYPQVSGFLTQLCVEEGQAVRKGQILFIIDQVPYKAALETAVANVESAKAGLATAQLTYDSKKELFAKKVVSEFDLKTAENSWLTAKAQLAQAKAQEVSARNNLSYTEVKSPADGVIGTLPYRVGALVSASLPQPLTTVSDNSDMYVYFSMTENQLLALTRQYGSKAEALKNMPEVELQLNDKSMYGEKGSCPMPPRSCNWKSKPVALPSSRIGGGRSGTTMALRMPANFCLARPSTASAFKWGFLRSSQGRRRIKAMPAF